MLYIQRHTHYHLSVVTDDAESLALPSVMLIQQGVVNDDTDAVSVPVSVIAMLAN